MTETREVALLRHASEVLDAMWYARYHGGQNGRDASKRWAELRRVANDIAAYRKENGLGLTKAREREIAAERLATALKRRAARGERGR